MKTRNKKKGLLFIKQFLEDFHHTGALAPSSRYLAQAITSPLVESSQSPKKILEVGAGTGVFTGRILTHLSPKSEFDIYECNEFFVDILEEKITETPGQVNIYADYIQNLEKSCHYQYIICGLPFNNFAPRDVEQIFTILLDSLEDGGYFSFFEYLAVRSLKKLFCCEKEIRRLRGVGRVMKKFTSSYLYEKKIVFRNVPPAVVWHLQIKK